MAETIGLFGIPNPIIKCRQGPGGCDRAQECYAAQTCQASDPCDALAEQLERNLVAAATEILHCEPTEPLLAVYRDINKEFVASVRAAIGAAGASADEKPPAGHERIIDLPKAEMMTEETIQRAIDESDAAFRERLRLHWESQTYILPITAFALEISSGADLDRLAGNLPYRRCDCGAKCYCACAA